jgi:MFS family permease
VLPITLALFAVAPLGGRLTGRLPLRVLLAAGLIGVAAGLLLVRAADPAESWTAMLPGFLVLGAGTGILSPALASAMIEALPSPQAGVASGVGNTFRQAGIAAGVAILGTVFRSEATLDAGLDAALLVAAFTAVAGALAALAIPAARAEAAEAPSPI